MWRKQRVSLTHAAIRILIPIVITLAASAAMAQHWNSVASFIGVHDQLTPYFLNENYGFVFNSGGGCPNIKLTVYRTVDGGVTWAQMNLGNKLSNQWGEVNGMVFVSPGHGFMNVYIAKTQAAGNICNTDTSRCGIYESLDSGNTWSKVFSDTIEPMFPLYAVGSTIFALSYRSSDVGKTWSQPNPATNIAASNRENLLFDYHLQFSQDFGVTWGNSQFDTGFCVYSSWGVPHTSTIVAVCDDAGSRSTISTSTDGGATFKMKYSRAVQTCHSMLNNGLREITSSRPSVMKAPLYTLCFQFNTKHFTSPSLPRYFRQGWGE